MLGLVNTSVAQAEPGGVKVGTLSCHERGGFGLILGSTRPMRCVFAGPYGSTDYDGHITRIGVDIGYHGPIDIVWAVFAPSETVGPGALAGHYGGVGADAALGVGLGANGLIGGSHRSFALQPVSVEGTTGIAVAAGIGGITLNHVPGTYEPA
jgi:hypothetical protein